MALPFFTIGHSTRPIDELVDLLSMAEVRLVVDVRTIPRSRTNPQYNSEALAKALSTPGSTTSVSRRSAACADGKGTAGERQCVLAEPELPQLRGLRHDRQLPFRTDQTARTGARYAVRDHVRGGPVVAMSSADHRRLSDHGRRDGIPHSRPQSRRSGTHDRPSRAWAGWNADLSCLNLQPIRLTLGCRRPRSLRQASSAPGTTRRR